MTISKPKVSLNIIGQQTLVEDEAQRVLFIGQQTSAGTATSGALVTNIDNTGIESTLFGENSMLANGIRAAKGINTITRFDAIPLDDNGGGTAAVGEVNFIGTATSTGVVTATINSKLNTTYEIGVSIGDTANDIATSLAALITADTRAPFTGVVNLTDGVDITYIHLGEEGNNLNLKVENTAVGITFALVAFAGGLTNPVLTDIFDVIEGIRYQTIVWPSTYTLTTLETFLEERFNVNNQVLDGVGLTQKTDTFANLETYLNALDSKVICAISNKFLSTSSYIGNIILEDSYSIICEYAAIRALRLSDGADISEYTISSSGSRDSFGGTAIASLPYFNTPFYNLPLTEVGTDFTFAEIDSLEEDGGVVLSNNRANTLLISGAAVTTYKTDIAGNPDLSFKYLNYVDTISSIREFFFNNYKARYAQSRLTSGDLPLNRNAANEKTVRSFTIGMYSTLSDSDYVLTVAGEDALRYFKQNLDVTLDLSLGKVSVSMKCPIVTQLREIVGTIQLSFNVGS